MERWCLRGAAEGPGAPWRCPTYRRPNSVQIPQLGWDEVAGTKVGTGTFYPGHTLLQDHSQPDHLLQIPGPKSARKV